jgi:hypothetical protein
MPNLSRPFVLRADTDKKHQSKNATVQEKSDLLNIWRPRADALRTFSFENQTIFATQDSCDFGFVQPWNRTLQLGLGSLVQRLFAASK